MAEESADEPREALPAPGQVTSLTMLERARAKDPAAWQRMVSLYQPLVRHWCARAGLGAEDNEDATQEVFVSASVNLPGFRRDRPGDTFRGWLRVITRNAILAHFRRHKGRPAAEGGSEALQRLQAVADQPGVEEEDEADQLDALHRRALELVRPAFEEKTWQAFYLSVVEGRASAAVAAELGMTPANIRQARSRVLRRLKQELGEVAEDGAGPVPAEEGDGLLPGVRIPRDGPK
jgi:RNA polymerase sigma-70 factor, ECF subfamily